MLNRGPYDVFEGEYIDMTDGGGIHANIRRYTLRMPFVRADDSKSRRVYTLKVRRLAKSIAGLRGARGIWKSLGDVEEFYPRGEQ